MFDSTTYIATGTLEQINEAMRRNGFPTFTAQQAARVKAAPNDGTGRYVASEGVRAIFRDKYARSSAHSCWMRHNGSEFVARWTKPARA